MKTSLRFHLFDLLCAITMIGVGIGVYRTFWVPNIIGKYWLWFGIYIAIVSVATCRTYLTLPRPSGFVLGVTIFGWAYLAFVLHCGLGISSNGGTFLEAADDLAGNSQLGLGLALLTGLAAQLWQSHQK